MGEDKIRHLLRKHLATGDVAFFWNPSKTLRRLGMAAEALGKIEASAKKRAMKLNHLADEVRVGARAGGNGPAPGSLSSMISAFKASDDVADLKPRTRKDYAYYLNKVEMDFGHLPATALSALVIKEYYRRLRREKGVTWAYHVMGSLRAAMSWGVSENWLEKNPALDVRVKSPAKRTVSWSPEQARAYIDKAYEMGWASLGVMALVADSTAQSPIDVRTLTRGNYDGRAISNVRTKTGVTDAPIPLFPDAKVALDAYLAERGDLLPSAPLFINDQLGGQWVYSTLCKRHSELRLAAGLPKALQFQDFRRTAQTEAGAAGATVDEIRGLARHTTRSAAEHYVHPDARFVESAQRKRLAARNENGPKVRTPDK